MFLILAYPKLKLKDGYDQYRKVRTHILHAYCLVTLSENRQLKRVVGIALDASSKVSGREGGSEDLLALEVPEWTPSLEAQVREARQEFDIMDSDRLAKSTMAIAEYPDTPQFSSKGYKRTSNQEKRATDRAKKLLRDQDRRWRKQQRLTSNVKL